MKETTIMEMLTGKMTSKALIQVVLIGATGTVVAIGGMTKSMGTGVGVAVERTKWWLQDGSHRQLVATG